MSFRSLLLAGAAAACVAASPAFADTIGFGASMGDTTPFSVSTNSTTATFSSPTDPGTFYVGSTAGIFSFPTALGDFASYGGDTLTVSFASALTQPVTIDFGLEDAFGLNGSDTLSVTSNSGVGATGTTALNSLFFAEPEGSVTLSAAGATSLSLTSANPFAISEIDVPEPSSLAVLLVGLAGLGAIFRRRQV